MATAQAPAKVAPKTSAAIKIAADSTVETCSQLMRRGRPWTGSFMGRNLYERGRRIKSAEDRVHMCCHPGQASAASASREAVHRRSPDIWVPTLAALGRDDTPNFGKGPHH